MTPPTPPVCTDKPQKGTDMTRTPATAPADWAAMAVATRVAGAELPGPRITQATALVARVLTAPRRDDEEPRLAGTPSEIAPLLGLCAQTIGVVIRAAEDAHLITATRTGRTWQLTLGPVTAQAWRAARRDSPTPAVETLTADDLVAVRAAARRITRDSTAIDEAITALGASEGA